MSASFCQSSNPIFNLQDGEGRRGKFSSSRGGLLLDCKSGEAADNVSQRMEREPFALTTFVLRGSIIYLTTTPLLVKM